MRPIRCRSSSLVHLTAAAPDAIHRRLVRASRQASANFAQSTSRLLGASERLCPCG